MISKRIYMIYLGILCILVLGVGNVGAEESIGRRITISNASFFDSKKLTIQDVSEIDRIGNVRRNNNVFKFNVGSSMGMTYERVMKGNFSLAFSPSFVYLHDKEHSMQDFEFQDLLKASNYVDFSKQFTLGGYIIPKIYLSKRKNTPSGWYIGMPIGAMYFTEKDTRFIYKLLYFGAAAGPGFQWIYPSGLAIDLSAAFGVNFAKVNLATGKFELFDSITKSNMLHLISLGFGFAY